MLVFLGLLWLVPTIGLFFTSLLDSTVVGRIGWWEIFSSRASERSRTTATSSTTRPSRLRLVTTLWVSIGSTILPIFLAALAAYAFAWLEFPGRDWLFLVVVALLVVPIQMALIPIFSLYNDLGLFDTIPGLILFHTAFGLPFAIFLLRNFFIGIPSDLLEAARIDGASELRIFFRLILPLGLPAIASLAIFQFLWVWNDLLVALDVRPRHAADHRCDLLAAAAVQREPRGHRAGRVRVAGDPARRLLRLPALLRRGAPRRLGQVGARHASPLLRRDVSEA